MNSNDVIVKVSGNSISLPPQILKDLHVTDGEELVLRQAGSQVTLLAKNSKTPYRIYSQEELNQFLEEDKLDS